MISKISSDFKSKFKITDAVTFASGVKAPCISGQVGQVGVMSQNGYGYPIDFWDKVLAREEVKDAVANRRMLGMIEHPTDDTKFLHTPYEEASHVVIKAWIQDHQPYATVALLNNEHGNAIKALIDVGVNVGVSTRGMGNFIDTPQGKMVDADQYCLLGWDIVNNPNFGELCMSPVTDSLRANPRFNELCEHYNLRDSGASDFNREALIRDASKLCRELQLILTRI